MANIRLYESPYNDISLTMLCKQHASEINALEPSPSFYPIKTELDYDYDEYNCEVCSGETDVSDFEQ